MATPPLTAEPIILLFDIQRAIATSKVGQDISKQLREAQALLQDAAKKISAELRSDAERLNEQRNLITRENLQTRAEELRVKENAKQRELNAQLRDLEASAQKATTEIGQLAAEQLEIVAKRRKADIVIRRDVLFHARTDWDVTDEVVKLMDKKQTRKKLE